MMWPSIPENVLSAEVIARKADKLKSLTKTTMKQSNNARMALNSKPIFKASEAGVISPGCMADLAGWVLFGAGRAAIHQTGRSFPDDGTSPDC
jgi:hypothetical protein